MHKNPKVQTAFLTNINKALDLLRRRKGMPHTFLWSEQEILNGNKNVVLGLLEDVHRLHDHVPPTAKRPYLGTVNTNLLGTRQSQTRPLLNGHITAVPATPPTELRPTIPTPSKYASMHGMQFVFLTIFQSCEHTQSPFFHRHKYPMYCYQLLTIFMPPCMPCTTIKNNLPLPIPPIHLHLHFSNQLLLSLPLFTVIRQQRHPC